jgi:hypothetical protein
MAEVEAKKWWQSKTAWGLIIALLSLGAKQLGVDVGEIDADFTTLIGGALAAWGLRTAQKPIGK